MSSLFVEIHESFLPEPLILTILMEAKDTSYHLSIVKESLPNQSVHLPSENMSRILFAGKNHKGYKWLV